MSGPADPEILLGLKATEESPDSFLAYVQFHRRSAVAV